MDDATIASIIRRGGQLASELLKAHISSLVNRSSKAKSDKLEEILKEKELLTPASRIATLPPTSTNNKPVEQRHDKPPITSLQGPSAEETTLELKRRLALELYKAELDLSNNLKIFGKPCDCLDEKHNLMIQAAAEELIAKEPDNSVYSEIIQWFQENQPRLTIEASASGKYDKEYPKMAGEMANFRKRAVGMESLRALFSAEDRNKIRTKTEELLEEELGE